MVKILVIGAGGVAGVAVHKLAGQLGTVFSEITLASRRAFKCEEIAHAVQSRMGAQINVAELDADHVDATVQLIKKNRR